MRANILCVAACEEEISVLKAENMLNMMSLVAGSVAGTYDCRIDNKYSESACNFNCLLMTED